MSEGDRARERLINLYREKAKHYDFAARFSPVPGYPQQTLRVRAVRALALRAGDSVVDVACGTGLNFPLIEQAIGPKGSIVGVDLTDAMLSRAQDRVEAHGWANVSLVQADAAAYRFPTRVDAILSTYALTQVPASDRVIAHGAAALSDGGRWVVLDLKIPDGTPRWLLQLGVRVTQGSVSFDEWIARRPWESIRAALDEGLDESSWTELCFGTAFLGVGSHASR